MPGRFPPFFCLRTPRTSSSGTREYGLSQPTAGAANPQSPTPSDHSATGPTHPGGEPKFFKAGYGLINVASALWGAFHAAYRMPLLALMLLLAAAIGIKRATFAPVTTRRVIYSAAAALATGLACVALVLDVTPTTSDTHQRLNSNENSAIISMPAIVTHLADAQSLFAGAALSLARNANERRGAPVKVVGRCETTQKGGKDATKLTLIVAPAPPPKAQAAETSKSPPNHSQSSEHHPHESAKESSESETGGAGSSDSANSGGNETQQANSDEPGAQPSAGSTTPSSETTTGPEGSSPSDGPGGTKAGAATQANEAHGHTGTRSANSRR